MKSSAPSGPQLTGRHERLLGRTVMVSALTFASRILGFVRESLSAALFGDKSAIFDAFVTAWRLPNLFRRFLGEGALSTALVTRLTEVDHTHGVEAGRALFWRTLRLVLGILTLVAAGAMALAHFLPDLLSDARLTSLLGPSHGAVLELSIRVMPFVVLVCLAAILTGALQVRGHFWSTMLAPVCLNVGWILALVVVGLHFGWTSPFEARPGGGLSAPEAARQLDMTRWLAWGILAAGTLQLFCQVPALFTTGFAGRFGRGAAKVKASAWSVLRESAPLAFGAAVYQINVMVDGFMAISLLEEGGAAVHYYANRVQQFPLAMVALAATSSVFPRLKELGHLGDLKGLARLHRETQLGIAFLAVPASLGLFTLSYPVSEVLFEHGAFESAGTARLSGALAVLALAIFPVGAVTLISRAFYALGDYRTPVAVSAVALVVNVTLNWVLVTRFDLDVQGLAGATVATSWLSVALLLPRLRRALHVKASTAGDQAPGDGAAPVFATSSEASFWVQLAKMVVCAVLSSAAAYTVDASILTLGPREAVWLQALGVAAATAVALFVYFGLALKLGLPQLALLRQHKRMR